MSTAPLKLLPPAHKPNHLRRDPDLDKMLSPAHLQPFFGMSHQQVKKPFLSVAEAKSAGLVLIGEYVWWLSHTLAEEHLLLTLTTSLFMPIWLLTNHWCSSRKQMLNFHYVPCHYGKWCCVDALLLHSDGQKPDHIVTHHYSCKWSQQLPNRGYPLCGLTH